MCPVTRFRSADYLKFSDGTWKFSKKWCDQLHVFAVQTILSFRMGLGKFRKNGVTSYTFFSQCRLYLKFLMWLGKFRQKSVTSYTFFRCGEVTRFRSATWSFWWDLEKFSQKSVPSHTCFFAVESILSFWGDLESFDKKVWPVTHFFSQWRLS